MTVAQHRLAEITLSSAVNRADPFNEATVDGVFTTPSGQVLRVPAFWAGGPVWRIRYASAEEGAHTYRTECSDPNDAGLHGVEGAVEVGGRSDDSFLYRHGPVVAPRGSRHFQHVDGTPFLWLGDTWWMGLCQRLPWPDGFEMLARDRVSKGFSVVQIVAGLYPDMGAFDARGLNEAGFPWETDYSAIRPEYFDLADRRILRLVELGLLPCIVGAWGYHLPWLGERKMERHWRTVIARWGALPVVWCIAGEANLPWYLAPGFPYDDREQVARWTTIARYVHGADPFGRPISIHPTGLGRLSARGAIDDVRLLDYDMLQTGHGDRASLGPTIETMVWSVADEPTMPVINSEVCYEGILGACHAPVQRLMFWSSMLSGAAGHTYGANGIWQVNESGQPYGASPHGGTWGATAWTEAMALPGSGQLGRAATLLRTLDWPRFEPRPGSAALAPGAEPRDANHQPKAAEISGKVRIIYVPEGPAAVASGLPPGSDWAAEAIDPATFTRADLGRLQASDGGDLLCACPFSFDALDPEQIPGPDWLIVLRRADG